MDHVNLLEKKVSFGLAEYLLRVRSLWRTSVMAYCEVRGIESHPVLDGLELAAVGTTGGRSLGAERQQLGTEQEVNTTGIGSLPPRPRPCP